MKIVIPLKTDGGSYERIQMEKYLRENILSKGHMILRKLAEHYCIHADYQNVAPNIVILHWILDRMIDERDKAAEAKVTGEKFGLTTTPFRTKDVDGVRRYKIKGYDPDNDSQFINEFTVKLAIFIQKGWALRPEEGEGVDLDILDRQLAGSEPKYLAAPPPILSVLDKPVAQPRGTRIKRVINSEDFERLDVEVKDVKTDMGKILSRIDSHEKRLAELEILSR